MSVTFMPFPSSFDPCVLMLHFSAAGCKGLCL